MILKLKVKSLLVEISEIYQSSRLVVSIYKEGMRYSLGLIAKANSLHDDFD